MRRLFALLGAIGLVSGAAANSVQREAPFDFGAPANLGAVINSPGFDGGPSISSDGLSLYFTSDRSGGSGGATSGRRVARDPPIRSGPRRTSGRASTVRPTNSPPALRPTVAHSTSTPTGPAAWVRRTSGWRPGQRLGSGSGRPGTSAHPSTAAPATGCRTSRPMGARSISRRVARPSPEIWTCGWRGATPMPGGSPEERTWALQSTARIMTVSQVSRPMAGTCSSRRTGRAAAASVTRG